MRIDTASGVRKALSVYSGDQVTLDCTRMEASDPVLIYDGHCRFCVRQAARLQRWVCGRVRLESFRDAGVIERYPGLTGEQCANALQLIEPDGRIYSGGEAIARTLSRRPLLAPLGRVYFVPFVRALADWAYRVVARNRFRLQREMCDDAACRFHKQVHEVASQRVRR